MALALRTERTEARLLPEQKKRIERQLGSKDFLSQISLCNMPTKLPLRR